MRYVAMYERIGYECHGSGPTLDAAYNALRERLADADLEWDSDYVVWVKGDEIEVKMEVKEVPVVSKEKKHATRS